jgi:DNA-binding response OmpR family regulator
MPRVLLVEPDRFLQRNLQKLFSAEGYFCASVGAGQEACQALGRESFDLVVMDLGQLRAEGLDVLRQIRASWHVPILLLAPRSDILDTVVGLEVGADDYLCEPFDPRELMARVRAQLRRADEYSRAAPLTHEIDLGGVVLDVDRRDAYRNGAALNLTAREFDLLHLLARHLDKALASGWIFESVWGCAAELGAKGLKVYVRRLRAKIEPDPRQPRYLLSVRGFGYKLVKAAD